MTSSNANIFRVTGPLYGEFIGPGEFPAQRPVTWSFDVFFDLRLNKRLSKQPWGWWFETPSWSLWRHCNGVVRLVVTTDIYKQSYHSQKCLVTCNILSDGSYDSNIRIRQISGIRIQICFHVFFFYGTHMLVVFYCIFTLLCPLWTRVNSAAVINLHNAFGSNMELIFVDQTNRPIQYGGQFNY